MIPGILLEHSHAQLFLYCLSLFLCCNVADSKSPVPAKLKIFSISFFAEKVCQSMGYGSDLICLYVEETRFSCSRKCEILLLSSECYIAIPVLFTSICTCQVIYCFSLPIQLNDLSNDGCYHSKKYLQIEQKNIYAIIKIWQIVMKTSQYARMLSQLLITWIDTVLDTCQMYTIVGFGLFVS